MIKILYIILSIIIAVVIWVYVDYETNDNYTTWITNIPVTFDGEDTLENRGLMIVHDESQETVNLRVSGKRATIMKLDRSNITITVKISQITGAGEQELEYTISYPRTVSESSVTVVNKSVETITVTVMAETTATIPVKSTFTGSVATGYRAGEIVCSPEEITVSGPEEIVETVSYALVTVSNESVTESIAADYTFTLMDENDEEVDASTLTCSTDTVAVSMNVGQTKTLELQVTVEEGGGATEDDVTIEISPATITVAGDGSTLAEIDSIDLGTIDLSEILTTQTYTKDINLPATLENVSGTTQATVTVTVSGLSVSTFTATQFNILNRPDIYTATMVTESLNVTLRGTEAALAEITAEDIIVVVDLSQIDFTTGSTGAVTVGAEIYVNSDDNVGSVGSYNVVVDVE
ncbi:MAG: hypothetical protein LUD79_00175 [Oscillospiraceae bacterium]|nr:hypothetical protein [Oscillospiraceae bacterium]